MKKHRRIYLSLLFVAQAYAAVTSTNTTVNAEVASGKDKYGSMLYEHEVKIETENFKVKNFWSKFGSDAEDNSKTSYDSIARTGKVQVSVEAASLCSLYSDLDKDGCSGQRPFLINDEAVSNFNIGDTMTLLFQKNYDGENILYNDFNPDVFYPLDVQRDDKFYKEEGAKSFRSFFSRMFDSFFGGSFFGSFFEYKVVDQDEQAAEDIRQRYIANIVSGIDQNHLLVTDSAVRTDALNQPVSLIEYMENQEESGSCNMFFFKMSEDNLFCNLMSAMPFINIFTSQQPSTNYTIDTIQADTENALISYAGSAADLTLQSYQDGIVYQKPSSSGGLISGMIEMMQCMFFGCTKVEEVAEPMDSYYAFDEQSASHLTFALTNDGTKIDGFETFKLMGIHSVAGNEHMCQVRESNYQDKWSSHTFLGSEEDTKEVTVDGECIRPGMFGFGCFEYEQITQTVANTYSAKYMSETLQSTLGIDADGDDELTPSEWLSWCDYMVEEYKDNVVTECSGFFMFRRCEEVPANVEEDGYEVLSYTNSSKKGLLLDLKRVELQTSDDAVELRYKLLKSGNE